MKRVRIPKAASYKGVPRWKKAGIDHVSLMPVNAQGLTRREFRERLRKVSGGKR